MRPARRGAIRSRGGPPDLDQPRDLLAGLACNDVEPQVRPAEGRDEQERIAEPELPGDVVTYRRAMSGEERRDDDRDRAAQSPFEKTSGFAR